MPMTLHRIAATFLVAICFVSNAALATGLSVASAKHAPKLELVEPSNKVIPANTLRFYLHFSNVMKRGQAGEHIWLENGQGGIIENPFLNLGVELWDPQQKRLTLLMDPGRIKTGVGPNVQKGPPLVKGHRYAIVVSENMNDAQGVATGKRQYFRFTAGEAVSKVVDLSQWQLNLPDHGSHEALIIQFDRIMDSGMARRMIAIYDQQGNRVKGSTRFSGRALSFTPVKPWSAGSHRMRVNPEIEDVSGNSIRVPFEKSGRKDDINTQTEIKFRIENEITGADLPPDFCCRCVERMRRVASLRNEWVRRSGGKKTRQNVSVILFSILNLEYAL